MTSDVLVIPVKKQYYNEIEEGIKKEEYREVKPYWIIRIEGKDFKFVDIMCGYSKKRIRFPWNGYKIKTIIHPQFENIATDVYAIKLER